MGYKLISSRSPPCLNNDGWKKNFVKNGTFLGDMLIFGGVYCGISRNLPLESGNKKSRSYIYFNPREILEKVNISYLAAFRNAKT